MCDLGIRPPLSLNKSVLALLNAIGLTHLIPMEFSIKLYIIKTGWPIVYIEGSQVIIFKKNIVFLSLKIDFVLVNSADPDEMPHFIWDFTLG